MLFSVAPKLEELVISPNRSRFELGPLEPGFGYTLGNSLRRTLLSSIPGAAITSIKVGGVLHEFDTVEGVTEDITELILNIKNIVVSVDDAVLNEDGYAEMHLRKSGPGTVTAADIQLPTGVEIYNPELYLATLNDKGTLEVEFVVEQGRGYISAANNKASGGEIGRIPIDSIYSPVLKVTYKVEATRVEQRTDFDKLVLDIETKGSMSPKDAVASAGHTLVELFGLARSMNLEAEGLEMGPTVTEQVNAEQLNVPIESLDLTVRSYNCLKREGIHTVGEVITRSEADLMDIRNFGAKSIDEVKEKLAQMGLALKDSPPGFDPTRYAGAYDDEGDDSASDDDQSFAEDEQL